MKDKLNILYTCDDAYLPLTAISMASVIKNNPDRTIAFYIATENENGENLKRLREFYSDNADISISYLDARTYDDLLASKGLDKWGSASYYVYWKLFAAQLLDVDEVWYLDSDVLCLNKAEYPVVNKAIGAVLDSAHACFNKIAHIDEDYFFFNTGSMYINVRKWKKERCIDKVLNYIRNMEYLPLMCDQDILAVSLQEDIEVIDPAYDYLVGYDYYGVHNSFEMYSLNKKPFYKEEEIEKAKNRIIFYHCLGGVFGRPWQDGNTSPIREEFERYRKLSAWPQYRAKASSSLLFRIEKGLEVLPKPVYNRIHNLAMCFYVKGLAKG